MSKERQIKVVRGVALIFVVAITIYIITIPEEQVSALEGFGYTGVFILSVLANATILLPAPGLLLVFTFGARFHPLGVALAAGTGAILGELSGYLAGFSGQAIIEDNKVYERLVSWMEHNGPLTIVVLAFIPNPLFDLTGMAAGALKMPVLKFLFWGWIGKFLKMLVTAYAGAGVFSMPWLDNLLSP